MLGEGKNTWPSRREKQNTTVPAFLSDNFCLYLSLFVLSILSILKTELNARNVMVAIGEYVIPVISYTFGIINWTEEEI